MMRVVSLALLFFGASLAAAQRVDLTDPAPRPAKHGSFIATAGGATLGAFAGFTVGMLVAPIPPGPDDLTAGFSVSHPDYDDFDEAGLAVVWGATVVGATAGAILGRHLTKGRQDFSNTLFGALVGVSIGALIAHRLDFDEPVPVAITLTIPTGMLSAFVGWARPLSRARP